MFNNLASFGFLWLKTTYFLRLKCMFQIDFIDHLVDVTPNVGSECSQLFPTLALHLNYKESLGKYWSPGSSPDILIWLVLGASWALGVLNTLHSGGYSVQPRWNPPGSLSMGLAFQWLQCHFGLRLQLYLSAAFSSFPLSLFSDNKLWAVQWFFSLWGFFLTIHSATSLSRWEIRGLERGSGLCMFV